MKTKQLIIKIKKELSTMKDLFDNKKEMIEYCGSGRVYTRFNEKEVIVKEYDESGDEVDVVKYEYDYLLLDVALQDETHVLKAVIDYKSALINDYDRSDNVNVFYYNGTKMWLDKDTRNGLMLRFNAESSMGKTETTLWYGNYSYTMAISDAITMLNALEVYASACYDNTASHLAQVASMDNMEAIYNYDFTQGYPTPLHFE